MSLSALDRHRWNLQEAIAHVRESTNPDAAAQVRAEAARRPASVFSKSKDEQTLHPARLELMNALMNGDLHAEGRRSIDGRGGRFTSGHTFYSGSYDPISPVEWREGVLVGDRLELSDEDFIDIRLPRFMVLAIWPPPATRPPRVNVGPYTTPYLDLMMEAIEHFDLTRDRQAKKENIRDWLRTKSVEGGVISKNLADAMATLVRMPSSQRGGAKRAG